MNAFLTYLGFLEKRTNGRRKQYTMQEYESIRTNFLSLRNDILLDMEKLGLSEWDLSQFESSTRALKLLKPTHTVLDESKEITGIGSFTRYPDHAIRSVATSLRKNRIGRERYSLSAPRGKFMGWPFPTPGSDRVTGNVIAVALIRLIESYSSRNLRELEEIVVSTVGVEAMTIGGERIMHTSKNLPSFMRDGRIEKSDIEPRVRLMAMSPKLHVMYNRRVVKDLLNCVIKPNPLHPVDKGKISQRINLARKKGWFIRAYDQAAFDRQHGKDRLRSVLDTVGELVSKKERDDLQYELGVPLKMPEGPIYRDFPMLLSGASSTTVIGCVASQLALASVLPLLGYTWNDFGSKWDALIWGDDLLMMIDRDIPEEDVISAYNEIGLNVSYEDKQKFLGYIYDSDYNSYPSFRLFQNLFPERIKNAPLFKLGVYSKLTIFNRLPRKETAQTISRHAMRILGEEYEFDATAMLEPWSRNIYVKAGIEEAQKISGGIGALDDIIYSLGHAVDLDTSYDLLGIPEDERSWQTATQLEKTIEDHYVNEIRRDPLHIIKRLANQELSNKDFESPQAIDVFQNESLEI
jgi:hypothetical protein